MEKVFLDLISSILKRTSFWLLLASIVFYNLNKYYLRFLSMENDLFRRITDVWPNVLIVIIFFFLLVLMRPWLKPAAEKRKLYYSCLIVFCGLLLTEEATGFLGMSKVADVNDGLASCFSAITLLMAFEVRQAINN